MKSSGGEHAGHWMHVDGDARSLGISASRGGISPASGPFTHAWMTAQRAALQCKNKGLQKALHHPIQPQNLHVQPLFFPSPASAGFTQSWTCEQVEKQIRPKRKQVHMEEFRSCLLQLEYLVAAPETCFNSCVCVFGGTLPQGNIFPFYCFK